jgi:hypothetical protein
MVQVLPLADPDQWKSRNLRPTQSPCRSSPAQQIEGCQARRDEGPDVVDVVDLRNELLSHTPRPVQDPDARSAVNRNERP